MTTNKYPSSSVMSAYVTEMFERDPKKFVSLSNVIARKSVITGDIDVRVVLEVVLNEIGKLERRYEIDSSFYEQPAHQALLLALGDLAAEARKSRSDQAYLLSKTLTPLMIGRHGNTSAAIDASIATLAEGSPALQGFAVDDSGGQRLVADAHLLTPLGAVRCLQNQQHNLGLKPQLQRFKDAARMRSKRALAQALQQALTNPEVLAHSLPNHEVGRAQTKLAQAEFFVIPNSAATNGLDLMGHAPEGDESGFMLCTTKMANQILRTHSLLNGDREKFVAKWPAVAAQVVDAYAMLATSLSVGLDGVLNHFGQEDRQRMASASLGIGTGEWNMQRSAVEYLIDSAATTPVMPDWDTTDLLSETCVDEWVMHSMQALGFRLGLEMTLLQTAWAKRDLVSSPATTSMSLNARMARFIDAVTIRTQQVHGWPRLVDSTSSVIEEVARGSNDDDDIALVTPRTLSVIIHWYEQLSADAFPYQIDAVLQPDEFGYATPADRQRWLEDAGDEIVVPKTKAPHRPSMSDTSSPEANKTDTLPALFEL